jgi:2'-5' RNA ligase
MRLFVALDIDKAIRERIAEFIQEVSGLAPEARWVRPESLHVTLKFIGWMADDKVEKVEQAMRAIHGELMTMSFRGCGFFPTARSARVFWIGIEATAALGALAKAVEESLIPLGVEPETRAYSAHLTLARGEGGSGSPRRQRGDRANRTFEQLQKKLAAMAGLEFGSMKAEQFFLYQSQLSPKGARYTKLATFSLR